MGCNNDTGKIEKEAKEIYELSGNYHLSDIMMACDKHVKAKLQKKLNEELESVEKELAESLRSSREDAPRYQKSLREKQERLRKDLKESRYIISVDYVASMSEDSGRVIRKGNYLCITLPQALRDKPKSDMAAIEKLRKTMAHEIGHITLHTEMMLQKGTQGSGMNMSSKKLNGFESEYLDKNREMFEHDANVFERCILDHFRKV